MTSIQFDIILLLTFRFGATANKEKKMPNYTQVLNEEIMRLARKEVKAMFAPLAEKVSSQRKTISALKKQLAEVAAKLDRLEKDLGFEELIDASAVSDEEIEKARVNPKYVINIRKKFGLSKRQMADLLGVNQNSLYLWESGKAKPRAVAKAKLIQLRKMGKREVKALLDEIENWEME